MKNKRVLIFTIVLGVLLLSNVDDASAGSEEKIPVIIGFKGKPSSEIVKGYEGDIKTTFTLISAIAANLPARALDAIKKHSNILYIENDYKITTSAQTLPWGVDRIDAEIIHTHPKTGNAVKIAVADTGIDYLHPDLNANYMGGYDFVNEDTDPWDDEGHGTHVAGTIAAEDNTIGVVGVAPEAHLYSLKVLDKHGSGYVSDLISAIEWAVNNEMQIISMSLGTDDYSVSLEQACNNAENAGLILVAAAGNDGDTDPDNDVDYPARYSSVIAVASTNNLDQRAPSSSDGPEVELATPGVSILSTYVLGKSHVYAYASGTSMACPHVTGVTALLLSSPVHPLYDLDKDGNWDNNEIRTILQDTAEDLGTPGRDNEYGYGLVNAGLACEKLQTNLTLNVEPETLNKIGNENTTISGNLTTYNTGILGTVQMYTQNTSAKYATPIEGFWSYLSSVQTDQNGYYEHDWDPETTLDDGYYCMKVNYTGNANYTSTSNYTGEESANLELISQYSYKRNLLENWNLIGIPFDIEDSTIESVFGENITYVDAIYGYTEGSWSYWFPVSSTLTELECGRGYWVLANDNFTVTTEGTLGDAPTMVEGWNLVGVNSSEPVSTVNYLIDTSWTVIYGYDAKSETWSYYINGVGGTLDTLHPGEGYWILVET